MAGGPAVRKTWLKSILPGSALSDQKHSRQAAQEDFAPGYFTVKNKGIAAIIGAFGAELNNLEVFEGFAIVGQRLCPSPKGSRGKFGF